MKRKFYSVIILSVVLFIPKIADSQVKKYPGKKLFIVNSYHKGYFWSDGEQEGLEKALAGTGIEVKVAYMDAKNNPSVEFSKQAAAKVKKTIDEFKPDILVTIDENAYTYVAMGYYCGKDLPVLFCGLDWDVSPYGKVCKNTTGILEIPLTESNSNHLRKFAKGKRVGVLGYDSPGEHDSFKHIPEYFNGEVICMEYVKDFASWKQKFLEIQDKADMLYLASPAGIKDWDIKEAEKFVLENVRVPIGADAGSAMLPVVLLGITKVPQEQGEYLAHAAMRILAGEKPSDIPIVKNKKGDLYLNLKIAEKIGVIFTPSMLRNAKEVIGKEK
jgi:hypothetical protein